MDVLRQFFFELYSCISVILPFSYYHPYKAPALINASELFPTIILYKLHELLHWMMISFVMEFPLERKNLLPE